MKNDYHDPRWIKRAEDRKIISERKCDWCSKEGMLNVHHVAYRKNTNLWDYPDEELFCLCAVCHESLHEHQTAHADALRDPNLQPGEKKLIIIMSSLIATNIKDAWYLGTIAWLYPLLAHVCKKHNVKIQKIMNSKHRTHSREE